MTSKKKNLLKKIKIFLKYKNGKPAVSSLKLISKPSHPIYYSASHLWKLDSKKKWESKYIEKK